MRGSVKAQLAVSVVFHAAAVAVTDPVVREITLQAIAGAILAL